MNDNLKLAWFAGLFEGEGTFHIAKEKSVKGLRVSSTDLDVLEKVKNNFGGSIFKQKETRNPKWKQPYIWSLCKNDSLKLVKDILPYLGERRTKRANEYLYLYSNMEKEKLIKKENLKQIKKLIFDLRDKGKKHKEIAEIIGYERSHITKILNGGISVVETQ